jgi:hypothetical protein
MMDRMRIYYNFIRPRMALNGKTPAEKTEILEQGKNEWLYLIMKSAKTWRINTRKCLQETASKIKRGSKKKAIFE